MKRFFAACAIALASYLPISAQNYASTFVSTIVSLSSGYSSSQMSSLFYNHYGVPTSSINLIYSSFGSNWGNVSIVLEISRTFGISVDRVYQVYKQYPNRDWPYIVNQLGYASNTTKYKNWYSSLNTRRTYWNDTFKTYKTNKKPEVAAREKRTVNQTLYTGFSGNKSNTATKTNTAAPANNSRPATNTSRTNTTTTNNRATTTQQPANNRATTTTNNRTTTTNTNNRATGSTQQSNANARPATNTSNNKSNNSAPANNNSQNQNNNRR